MQELNNIFYFDVKIAYFMMFYSFLIELHSF